MNTRSLQLIITSILLTFYIASFSQTLLNQLNTIAANNDMMGGSVVVFCEDGIIENLATGKSDYARNIDMSVNSKYRIASISKTITAIAIMQVVEQDLLDLDDNISTILGYSVQNPDNPSVPITVRMLLSHTSSIIDGPTYSSFMTATVNNNPIPDLSELLTPFGTYYTIGQFNNTVPGTYFNYANVNYVILGTILEKVTNVRFDEYCKQNISDLLGIDASFNVNHLTDINEVAVLYRKPGGIWTPQADNYQGIQPVWTNLSGYVPGTNGGRFGPQGGFRCSAEDLASIFLALMNDGTFDGVTLLSPASCDTMFANEWTYNGSNGNNYNGLFRSWGLGIHRITSTPGDDIVLPGSDFMLGHAGEAYGLVSDAYIDTTRKAGLVFITNGVGIGYHTNNYSAFYTVEQEIFEAIENYANIPACLFATEIGQFELPAITLYPNPCSDYINITGSEAKKVSQVKIFALDGRQLRIIRLKKGETKIDIKDLISGFYILETDGMMYSFIKE